ncbi:spherulation-specific family 4 protein [Streptomyces sp. NPDC060194]|uniref:spherulation-specific family 4 protein n=1 Tax=Streptomyces sp. NPDC060194 TaxID=3347069 RepID=UPI00364E9525
MPHLTRWKRQQAVQRVAEEGRLLIGAPGYAHPLLAPAEWAELGRPATPLDWAVLNVADGPGVRPDPQCLAAAARLRDAGRRVLGHLDLVYGSRPLGELITEAARYLEWYRVDGFYLDRAPIGRESLPGVRTATTALGTLRERTRLVLAHGTQPHADYAELADQLVTFDGPWAQYRWSQVAEWTADHPPERFCHLVHGVPRPHLDEALRVARWQGAGTVFLTDHADRSAHGLVNPYGTLPGYWDEIVSRIGPAVSE